MQRSSPFPTSYRPVARSAKASKQTTKGISDFLSANERMAALLPAVARLVALQKDCAALLPPAFDVCEVQKFESGQLVLSVPNAALAAKLKQQLPKLQEALSTRGWQVNAIKLKLQVRRVEEKTVREKELRMPAQALASLAKLGASLEDSPLKDAIRMLLQRHRGDR